MGEAVGVARGDLVSGGALRVRGLVVGFPGATRPAVRGVSFAAGPGRMLAIVGESGSGKSVSVLSLMGLAPGARVMGGEARWRRDGREVDLLALRGRARREARGRELAYVFQDHAASLNPVVRVGDQVGEVAAWHSRARVRGRAARELAAALLAGVGVGPERMDAYPHELSGGLRQRATMALALACEPGLLIADEPTTALDAVVRSQVLDVLGEVRSRGVGVVLVSHDLTLVAGRADDVCVMWRGRVVESGPAGAVLGAPAHPYTRALLACAPRAGAARGRLATVGEALRDEREPRLAGGELAWLDRPGQGEGRLVRVGDGRLAASAGDGPDDEADGA